MAQTVNTICFARSDHVHLDGFGVALGCHLVSLLETLVNQSPNLSVKWGAQNEAGERSEPGFFGGPQAKICKFYAKNTWQTMPATADPKEHEHTHAQALSSNVGASRA